MAIVEIGSEVYNIPEQVASKILDMSFKIEELEMEVRKLKKDVLDEEINWHSQRRKRMAEKREKLKYKQIINELEKYLEYNKDNSFDTFGVYRELLEKLQELKGEENESN